MCIYMYIYMYMYIYIYIVIYIDRHRYSYSNNHQKNQWPVTEGSPGSPDARAAPRNVNGLVVQLRNNWRRG